MHRKRVIVVCVVRLPAQTMRLSRRELLTRFAFGGTCPAPRQTSPPLSLRGGLHHPIRHRHHRRRPRKISTCFPTYHLPCAFGPKTFLSSVRSRRRAQRQKSVRSNKRKKSTDRNPCAQTNEKSLEPSKNGNRCQVHPFPKDGAYRRAPRRIVCVSWLGSRGLKASADLSDSTPVPPQNYVGL